MSLVVLLVSKGHYKTTLTRTELKCANFSLFREMGSMRELLESVLESVCKQLLELQVHI